MDGGTCLAAAAAPKLFAASHDRVYKARRSTISVFARKLEKIEDAIEDVNRYLGRQRDPISSEKTDQVKSRETGKKGTEDFRNYIEAKESVRDLYREQHSKQTVAFNIAARKRFLGRCHKRMTVWQALEMLDTLVDESDPDTDLGQIQHLLQTAEAMRRDGQPDWMQLTGLLHDLGKLLVFFGAEGQWDVVGDTFVVGCAFSDKTIYSDTFDANPDRLDTRYNTKYGMYQPGCGVDNLLFSWGHDEYMYGRLKTQSSLPQVALDMIRLHSCYPLHREGAYRHFFAPGDEEKIRWVQTFNKYDLYSKSDRPPNKDELRPYYESLIDKYIIGGRDALLEW